MTQYVFEPQVPVTVPVVGSDEQFPVRRVYCVGRNYAAHAREMGFDPDREPPFFANRRMPLFRLPQAKRWRCRIRRRPITTITKLNWWWPLVKRAVISRWKTPMNMSGVMPRVLI